MTSNEAAKDILQELIKVAADEGRIEEEHLGRPLDGAEVGRIADMVMRRFETALVIGK